MQGDVHTTTLPRFDKLVELHYPSLFHFAVRLCNKPETALKLTQRTFRLALERSHDLPVPSNVRSWLFTILFREFLELRPRNRRPPLTRIVAPHVELVLEGNPQLN
jgi:DNA-directed RNA polymerase specialized sigma24 family protein